jgi:hypothetical protein
LKPGGLQLLAIGVTALALCINESEFLLSMSRDGLAPLGRRLDAALCGLSGAASAAFAGEDSVRSPGPAFAAVAGRSGVTAVDEDGYVTTAAQASEAGGVPLIKGFEMSPREPGRLVSSPEILMGLCIIKAFEGTAGLAGMIDTVDLRNLEDPEVKLRSGALVKLGNGDYAHKLEKLREVIFQAAFLGMRPELIDLRFRDQVVVWPGAVPPAGDKGV